MSITVETENYEAGTYRVSVEGTIAAFVLSRPLFMAFGTYGLYRISYKHGVFKSYDSTADAEQYFILQRVTSYNNASLYPNTNQMLSSISDVTTLPITAYYMNYVQPISPNRVPKGNLEKSDVNNTLSLIFSSSFLEKTNSNVVSYVLPTAFSNSSPNTLPNSATVTFTYNKIATVADEIVKITVRSGRDMSNIAIVIPPIFLNILTSLRTNNSEHRFHVCFTYSMDAFTTVCFLEDIASTYQCAFVEKQTVKSAGNYIHIVYDNDSFMNAVPAPLKKEIEKYKEFCTISSIPNYAYVAKFLGYNI